MEASSYEATASEGSYNIDGDDDGKETKTPQSPWKKLPLPQEPRDYFGVVAWRRDCVLVVGGSRRGTNLCLASVEVYNRNTRSWTFLEATLHTPRRHCAVAITNERYLYVMGGNSNANRSLVDLDSVECLDLWNPQEFVVMKRTLPFPIRNTVALAHESHIFMVGGYSSTRENGKENEGNDAVAGYCDSLWVWDTKADLCHKLHKINQPRWLPAVAIVRGDMLLIAGGYNGRRWLNDVEIFHVLKSQWKTDEDDHIPNIPCKEPPIHACWSRMNQLAILSHNTMFTWDWGSTKWRKEEVVHTENGGATTVPRPLWKHGQLSIPRAAAGPNCIVCLDSEEKALWERDRPTHPGISELQIATELQKCENDIRKAAKVGFWELAALDKAAEAHTKIPILEVMLIQLETIRHMQTQKDALVQGFSLSQSEKKWTDCQRIAWDIRDVEDDLEKAHQELFQRQLQLHGQVATSNVNSSGFLLKSPSKNTPIHGGEQSSPLRGKRSALLSASIRGMDLMPPVASRDDDARGIERSYNDSCVFELSSVDFCSDLLNSCLIEDIPEQAGSPPRQARMDKDRIRRHSSRLLEGLLSVRDLKELARSSDADTRSTAGFY